MRFARASQIALVCLASAAFCQAAHAVVEVFHDQASFLAATQTDFYLEDFSAFSPGFIAGPLEFGPVNGYEYTIYDRTPEGEPSVWGLFAGDQVMSTDTDSDSLVVDLTGDPVTAIGGNFFLTDFSFNVIGGGLVVELDEGTTISITLNDPNENSFLGFLTSAPISRFTLTGTIMPTIDTWPTMDNFYVGSASRAPCNFELKTMACYEIGDLTHDDIPTVPEPSGAILLLTFFWFVVSLLPASLGSAKIG